MTVIAAICIIACTFIVCLFAFFTVVYISELRREKYLRTLLMSESQRMSELMHEGHLPVIMVDVPVQKSAPVVEPSFDKNKKNVN